MPTRVFCRPAWTYLLFLPLITFQASAVPTEIPPAASFYVPNLPGLHQDPTRPLHIYAGHILSDPNAPSASDLDVLAHLFFVMVKARRAADKERLMFWFNGGPGCSSLDGLMMEVGPWKVDGNGGLKTVEGGWEEYTTMVYVDQPAGTGLSYTSTNHYLHTLQEATDHVIKFLRTFYQVFPEYLLVDTYLGGESFAGQYIPYFADAILDSGLNIPLRGAAIGNGWIDGRNQYPAYLEYAATHGIIDTQSQDYRDKKWAIDECLTQFDGLTFEPVYVDDCEKLTSSVLESKLRTVDGEKKCVNVYDVRLEDDFPACGMNWPPDLRDITSYLAREDVVRALHATGKSENWVECHGRVGNEMRSGPSASSITLLPSVIERIPVLLFAGDQDYICNYMGIEKMIDAMTWNGEKGLGTAQTEPWTVAGTPAGTWVSSRNLTYVKVFNASHMVPYDVPDVAHDMILRFMGVDFSAILEGSAHIPSSVGDDVKPIFMDDENPVSSKPPGTTPEQTKAQWDAYYNAGTAALVFLLVVIGLGICLWCRLRRKRVRLSRSVDDTEENIPLRSASDGDGDELDFEQARRKRKGKGREIVDGDEGTLVFDVGEADED
ncbi:Alpha/Beta hydrolase protein [Boletus coccyginus]|nr:Alpha/Beta hydrolase protein [Boletus coccyginus]